MIGQYEVWLCHWDGTRLAYLDGMLSLEYTRAVQGIGACNVYMPSLFDVSLVQEDYKLAIYRALPGQSKRLENVYVIQAIEKSTDENGVPRTQLVGLDGNQVLMNRVIIGQPESSYTRKTGLGANLVKAYTRDAIASAMGPDRALVASYFTVAANANEWTEYSTTPASWATEKASFTENRDLQILYDAANGICARSTGRGYPIWWQVVALSESEYQLRTYKTLVGQNLTSLTLSPDNSMSNPVYRFDSTEEKNAVVVAGESFVNGMRTIFYQRNVLRTAKTPFAVREAVHDMGSAGFGEMNTRATEELTDPDNRPRETFKCSLSEIENFRYGREWDLGDKVSLSYRGFEYEPMIQLVGVNVGSTERITVAFDIEQELEIV